MTDVASKGSTSGDDRPVLTNRQGHPVYDNQNQRTIGARGPATLENYQFLEKISHFDRERIPERVVHARGATAFGYFEAVRRRRRRADRGVHPRQAVPGEGQAHRPRDPLLHRRRWPGLLRGRPRPARLRGEVLHRGRQLGPRRQQPRRLLHPRRDQVPRLHPLPEARPGDLRAPGPQPRLRLHQPDARGDAHGHAGVQPARHPGELPHQQGFGVNTYKWVNAQGETKLVKYHWLPKQGVKSYTGRGRREHPGQRRSARTRKDLYDAIEPRRLPRVGAAACS